MYRWSYGHDSKCATFSWCRRLFTYQYLERMRKTNEKFSTGKWLSSGFSEIQVSEALRDLSLCVSFWQRIWILKSLKDFSCVVRVRSEYVIHSVRSGEFSALWIMTIRPTKHFLFDKVLTTPTFLAVWTPLL